MTDAATPAAPAKGDRNLRLVLGPSDLPRLAFPDGTIVGNVLSISTRSDSDRCTFVTCEIVVKGHVQPPAEGDAWPPGSQEAGDG